MIGVYLFIQVFLLVARYANWFYMPFYVTWFPTIVLVIREILIYFSTRQSQRTVL